MLERDLCLREAWLPHPTPLTPTKHLSCLMCPIELHSVTPDAVISGTDVRMCAEAPGAITWARASEPGVGRARPHRTGLRTRDKGGAAGTTSGSFLPVVID